MKFLLRDKKICLVFAKKTLHLSSKAVHYEKTSLKRKFRTKTIRNSVCKMCINARDAREIAWRHSLFPDSAFSSGSFITPVDSSPLRTTVTLSISSWLTTVYPHSKHNQVKPPKPDITRSVKPGLTFPCRLTISTVHPLLQSQEKVHLSPNIGSPTQLHASSVKLSPRSESCSLLRLLCLLGCSLYPRLLHEAFPYRAFISSSSAPRLLFASIFN